MTQPLLQLRGVTTRLATRRANLSGGSFTHFGSRFQNRHVRALTRQPLRNGAADA